MVPAAAAEVDGQPSGMSAHAIANIDKFLERTESHLRGLQNFHQDDDRKMNVRTFDTNDTFDTSMMYGTLPMKAGKRVFQTLLLTKTVIHQYRGAQPLFHALFSRQNTV